MKAKTKPDHYPRAQSKIRLVPINQMRTAPVHVTQRPFNPSWGKKIAKEMDLDKLGHPVVNFRDGVYLIIDGQHRVYGLRENGFENDNLPCEVYEGLSDEECARIFLGRNDSKSVQSFDKFKVSCTAGDTRSLAVRRAVETQGLKITRDRDENCVGAVTALLKVYDVAGGGHIGEVVLGQVVRTLKLAYQGDPRSFDAMLISGLGLSYNRYNGRTDEKRMTDRLATVQGGYGRLLQKAEDLRTRTGNQKAQCVAAVIVDVYNRGASKPKDKLPSWWKNDEV
jgi:hypothetical protein